MNRRIIIGMVCAWSSMSTFAWDWWPLAICDTVAVRDTLEYTVGMHAVSSTGSLSPYWIQTNRHGDIAPSAHSGNISAGVVKRPTCPTRWWDWDAAVTLTGRVQSNSEVLHPNTNIRAVGYSNLLYAHARLWVVDITAGIKPQQYGIPDPELSIGGLVYSYNAHPMPRITAGLDNWMPFPGLFGYMEIIGGISHEWMADNIYVRGAKVHHKWVGGRIGGKLPVNISYQFHHIAQWGGYSPEYGDLGNDWQSFKAVFLARAGGSSSNERLNALGNHMGEQILTLEFKHRGWHACAYWHNMFEDGPQRFIGTTMNVADGLWGLHISQQHWPYISGITYEFFNSTDQSGPYHDKDGMIFGGADCYFVNSIYRNGWNYYYRTIGSGMITSPLYNTDGSLSTRNNRVMAHYAGIKGDIFGYRYRVVYSYAMNYGLYRDGQPSTRLRSTASSWMAEVIKQVPQAWNLEFGLTLAGDVSGAWGNTFGAMLSIRKTGIIQSY